MNASKSINIKIAIILTAKINRIMLNEILAHKQPNFAQNWNFWPNIGIFGPFGLMAGQKTMQTRCIGGFPLGGYQTFCFLPLKSGILSQKRPNLNPEYAFVVILGQILAFLDLLVSYPTKKQCGQVVYVVFRYISTKTFTKYCHFLHIFSNAWPKTNVNKVPRWFLAVQDS